MQSAHRRTDMATRSVYVADVYRPGLADPEAFAFLDKDERDAFAHTARTTKWYRVDVHQIALQDSSALAMAALAMAALKDAFGV
jgi:hypothetical protein